MKHYSPIRYDPHEILATLCCLAHMLLLSVTTLVQPKLFKQSRCLCADICTESPAIGYNTLLPHRKDIMRCNPPEWCLQRVAKQ